MSSFLRKCVSVGEAQIKYPGASNPQDLRFNTGRYLVNGRPYHDNLYFFSTTGTKWARFWVLLTDVWPTANYVDQVRLDTLDLNIALARIYGGVTNVILTFHHDLPSWINGSSNPRDLPANTSFGGPWSYVLSAFAQRYSAANPGRPYDGWSLVDVIEPFNEPNLLSPPAYADGTTVSSRCADLLTAAKKVITYTGNAPMIGGPCVHDTDSEDSNKLNYYDFTRRVLDRLGSNGFYAIRDANGASVDHRVVWTMHNYNDVERDHGSNTLAPDRSTYHPTSSIRARTVLRSRKIAEQLNAFGWRGWPNGTPGEPGIFITEGGTDLDRMRSIWGFSDYNTAAQGQANLLQRSLDRLGNDTSGWGVGLTTNYLWYSGPANSGGNTGFFNEVGAQPPYPGGEGRFYSYLAWSQFPGRS